MQSCQSIPPFSSLLASTEAPYPPSTTRSACLSPPHSPTRHPARHQPRNLAVALQEHIAHHSSPVTYTFSPSTFSMSAAAAETTNNNGGMRATTAMEEEAIINIINISRQISPTPALPLITLSPSSSPHKTVETEATRTSTTPPPQRQSAFSVVAASSSLLKVSSIISTPEELAAESQSGENRKRSICPTEDRPEKIQRSPPAKANRKKPRTQKKVVGGVNGNGDKTNMATAAAAAAAVPGTTGKKRIVAKRRREEEEDEDYQDQVEEEDGYESDDYVDAEEDTDDDFAAAIASTTKKPARKRSKLTSLMPLEECGSPSDDKKPNRTKTSGMAYLHELGTDLRNYLAAWLSRHTVVSENNHQDPIYHCVKCIPPAGEQTKVSASDRHKPGRVRIAIPQQYRRPHLPEKILASHASSALFGQLPSSQDLAKGFVASHRCGHSWCVASHHLVWEPLGAKLARERGKQSCPGGDACRHGPLKCFKM